MRFADHAFKHSQDKTNDPDRIPELDKRARNGGFENTPDYIHDVQGRKDTKSFNASNDRVFWANEKETMVGWNNNKSPEKSTVFHQESKEQVQEKYRVYRGREVKAVRKEGGRLQDRNGVAERSPTQSKGQKTQASKTPVKDTTAKQTKSENNAWSQDRVATAKSQSAKNQASQSKSRGRSQSIGGGSSKDGGSKSR